MRNPFTELNQSSPTGLHPQHLSPKLIASPYVTSLQKTYGIKEGWSFMRKALGLLLLVVMLFGVVAQVEARPCGRYKHKHGNTWHTHYSCVGDNHKHGRSFWEKHRDKLTTAAGAGAGAAIGGIAGGGKGAAIGALAGGGGAAVYTYGVRKRRKSAKY